MTMMRIFFLAIFFLQFLNTFAQVNISGLSLKNRDTVNGYLETAYCYSDSILVNIDTNNVNDPVYLTAIYATDSKGNVSQSLYSHIDSSGLFDLNQLQRQLNSAKQNFGEPLMKLSIKVQSANSSDSASIFIINKNLPDVDSVWIRILGKGVFDQPNALEAGSGAPGPWVGPNVVIPNILFDHGYYDFFELKLNKYDTTGHFSQRIKFEAPFDSVITLDSNLRWFSQFNVAGRLKDTANRFENNSKRESYKFTFCYGVTGCGMDSVELYFRTITKEEVGLFESAAPLLLEVYPNPTVDHFSLSSAQSFDAIELVNTNGETVRRFENDGLKDSEFNISELPAGLYFLKAKIEGRTVTRRLIKR